MSDLPSTAKHRAFYERWVKQHRNVEALMGTLLAVEEDALRQLATPPRHIEGAERELRERLARSLAFYEDIVCEAIKQRNKVEAVILASSVSQAKPVPEHAPRSG